MPFEGLTAGQGSGVRTRLLKLRARSILGGVAGLFALSLGIIGAADAQAAKDRGGRPLRVVPTRANTQPAFGCYLPDAHAAIARATGLFVLTLEGDAVAAITWFTDTGLFQHFGLPRTLSSP